MLEGQKNQNCLGTRNHQAELRQQDVAEGCEVPFTLKRQYWGERAFNKTTGKYTNLNVRHPNENLGYHEFSDKGIDRCKW